MIVGVASTLEGKEHLNNMFIALEAINQTVTVSRGSKGSVIGKYLKIQLSIPNENAIYEDQNGYWHAKSFTLQRVFEHEIQHIIQIATGTVRKYNKIVNARWTNKAEEEAVRIENKLAASRGEGMRACRLLIPKSNTKKEEFMVAIRHGCDGTVIRLLQEWIQQDQLNVSNSSEDRLDLLAITPEEMIALVEKSESIGNNPKEQQFFSHEISKRRKKILVNILLALMQKNCDVQFVEILKKSDLPIELKTELAMMMVQRLKANNQVMLANTLFLFSLVKNQEVHR